MRETLELQMDAWIAHMLDEPASEVLSLVVESYTLSDHVQMQYAGSSVKNQLNVMEKDTMDCIELDIILVLIRMCVTGCTR